MTHARPTAAQLNEYSRRIALNRWLDVQVLRADDTGVELHIPWREELGGAVETRHAHGGILACIVDIAVGLGTLAALGHGGPSVDLRTDFLRGAAAGPLHAVGRVARAGRTIVFVEVSIQDVSGEVVATGRGVSYIGSSRRLQPFAKAPAGG